MIQRTKVGHMNDIKYHIVKTWIGKQMVNYRLYKENWSYRDVAENPILGVQLIVSIQEGTLKITININNPNANS